MLAHQREVLDAQHEGTPGSPCELVQLVADQRQPFREETVRQPPHPDDTAGDRIDLAQRRTTPQPRALVQHPTGEYEPLRECLRVVRVFDPDAVIDRRCAGGAKGSGGE